MSTENNNVECFGKNSFTSMTLHMHPLTESTCIITTANDRVRECNKIFPFASSFIYQIVKPEGPLFHRHNVWLPQTAHNVWWAVTSAGSVAVMKKVLGTGGWDVIVMDANSGCIPIALV